MWLPMISPTSETVTKADWSALWMMRRMAGSSKRVMTQYSTALWPLMRPVPSKMVQVRPSCWKMVSAMAAPSWVMIITDLASSMPFSTMSMTLKVMK